MPFETELTQFPFLICLHFKLLPPFHTQMIHSELSSPFLPFSNFSSGNPPPSHFIPTAFVSTLTVLFPFWPLYSNLSLPTAGIRRLSAIQSPYSALIYQLSVNLLGDFFSLPFSSFFNSSFPPDSTLVTATAHSQIGQRKCHIGHPYDQWLKCEIHLSSHPLRFPYPIRPERCPLFSCNRPFPC